MQTKKKKKKEMINLVAFSATFSNLPCAFLFWNLGRQLFLGGGENSCRVERKITFDNYNYRHRLIGR